MVQIYQASTVSSTNIWELQKRITACMDALKDISGTWLVAKMVHEMFEAILELPEIENRLRRGATIDHSQDIRQRSISQKVESPMSTSSAPSRSESATRAIPLTPSLAQYMAAALQSATKKQPSSTHINQKAKTKDSQGQKQEQGIYTTILGSRGHSPTRPEHLQQHELSFVPETSRMEWDHPVPEDSQSMGLNTDEW